MANIQHFTANPLGTYSPIDCNAGYRVHATITLSSSYTQGGDTCPAALFGLGQIIAIECQAAGGYVFAWNQNSVDAGAKIQAWYNGSGANTLLLEATGTTNFNAVPFEVVVYGY